MNTKLLAVALLAGAAPFAQAQEITPVWVQHLNGLVNVDAADKLPIVVKNVGAPYTANGIGRSQQFSLMKMRRYDSTRFLMGIRENGIDEQDGSLSQEKKDLAAAYPDRSLIWIDAANGKPMGVAHVFGLRPITATGQGNNNDFWSNWDIDDAPEGQRALYSTHKNTILRWAPHAGGGWEATPTCAWVEPTKVGNNFAKDCAGNDLDGSSDGDGDDNWRWRDFRVAGSGTGTVMTAGGGTWRASHHVQLFRTTDGLVFLPAARFAERDDGRKGGYSQGGLTSHVVQYGLDSAHSNLMTAYHGRYPGTGWYAYPSRFIVDPDSPANVLADTYSPTGTVLLFEVNNDAWGSLPAFQWEAAGQNGLSLQHAVDGVEHYDGNWGGILDANKEVEYLVNYAFPSWNNQFGSIKKPGWLGVHRLDGSIAANGSYKLPFTEMDIQSADNGTEGGNEFGYDGDVGIYPDTTAPANLDRSQVAWVGSGYGYGLFTVQNVAATIVAEPHDLVVTENSPLTVSARIGGSPNRYQWYKDGVALDSAKTNDAGGLYFPPTVVQGVNKPKLVLAKASVADSGKYKLVAVNPLGTVTTREAVVTVHLDISPPAVARWPMRQRDPGNTGRADFPVPGSRLNGTFFDNLRWQKRSPGSPDEGRLGATTMVFHDGVGPDGADLVLGGYHWPKGVQGMDRKTGRFFWAGNPDGGESIGGNSAAFSLDGRTLYVANDATPHPLMAFRSDLGPSTFWHNGADAVPDRLGPWSPKVSPDGRIFSHAWADRPYGATDHGNRLELSWSAQSEVCPCYGGPALFLSPTGLQVASGGRCGWVKSYDGLTGADLWAVHAGAGTDADPTIDPETGNLYLPVGSDHVDVVGLTPNGQPLWGTPGRRVHTYRPGENNPQRAQSAGCLSHDGGTYYFQTVSQAGDGHLYAISTADGSVKWSYPTRSRGWEDRCSSPIVTPNGVVVVGNNENGTYFALRDRGTSAQLLDTLAVAVPGTATASATLAPDGLLYLPARLPWTQGNGDPETPSQQVENLFNAFDLAGGPGSPLPAPSNLQAAASGRAIALTWSPVDDPAGDFAYYAVYRSRSPLVSVVGLTPIASVGHRLDGSFTDSSIALGKSYYYAVTTVSTGGGESDSPRLAGPVFVAADRWPMRQRDAFNTGRADFAVPAARLNDRFFDALRWQKRTPGSPSEGGLSTTTLIFYDGVGPGGADLLVGGYHWPKGVQGLDRHTGRFFWTGNPDGGESIGANSAAFSPDGRTLYVANDASSHPLMAFASATGPSAYWHNGADPDPYRLDRWTPKVAPDGRILSHSFPGPSVATDDGTRLSLVWGASTDLCAHFSGPAWLSAEGTTLVVGAGGCGRVAAFDPATGAVAWTVATSLPTEADPTVDPANGRIYLPAGQQSVYVVGLDRTGTPLWGDTARRVFEWRSGENHPQRADSAGCLSHDGATFYFQTVSQEGDGQLYAVHTADGSVKWTFATRSRGWGERRSSPIVTADGVIVVGNNDNGTYFALRDTGASAVLLDTLVTAPGATAAASATLAPNGLLYLPARLPWIQSNGDGETPSQQPENLFSAFDLTEDPPITLPPPPALRGLRLNHAVQLAWAPVSDGGGFFSHYAVYRATQPFASLSGLLPLATVPDRLATGYLDPTPENGSGYYYFVTTVTLGGRFLDSASPVGPIFPADETDLQVVSVSRTPRFPRYQPQYTGYELTEPSGFGPYYVSAATALGPGESPSTPRWPDPGAPVTYTATIRNRGSNPWTSGVHAHWEWDGAPAGAVLFSDPLPPGATATFSLQRPWDGQLHEARFVLDDPDARPDNNALAVGTKSVPFLTYIDEGFYQGFVSASKSYPGAVTDDLIDWLNRHMTRFNEIFAEAGTAKRVHYDVLELLPDSAPDPVIPVPAFGIFPFRYQGTPANPRLSGWYDAAVDIDFGLLHEMGHQLGLIDLYQMDIWPAANLVSGLPYFPWDDLMRLCSPFLSPHGALGMEHWLDQAHGYFGQYLYGLPARMRLRVVDAAGQPLPGVAVTLYQLADRPGLGKVVTTQVKAQGTTDAAGEWVLPNVPLDPDKIPPLPTGDTLRDNPFGYVDMIGRNGVLHFRLEHDGKTCFAWLGIVEANVAYDRGQTDQATFVRRWSPAGGLAPAVPALLPVNPLQTDEDTPLVGVPLPALDGDTQFEALTYSVESSDPALLPPAGLVVERTRTGARLSLAPAPNASGNAEVIARATDGTATTETRVPVTVRPVNDPPVVSSPASLSVSRNGSATVPGISVEDPDAGSEVMTLWLSALHGRVTVSSSVTDGLVSEDLDGNGTKSVRIDAPRAALNATLAAAGGLLYAPEAEYLGADELLVRVDDHGHTGAGGAREATATVAIQVRLQPRVVGRHVFYNQSFWDGNDAAANAADDAAIAPDKTPLLPGGKATFANYTSYPRGLNGIMVDLQALPGTPTAADFGFRVGNGNTLSGWVAGPAPASVTVRRGAGIGGSDRLTLVWGADAVKKRWLEVTVRATDATGLAQPDLFYFGNALGETGNSPTDARVTSADALRVLGNVRPSAPVGDRFDVNRDGKVGAGDRLQILGNVSVINPLQILDLAAAGSVAAPAGRTDIALPVVAVTRSGDTLRVHYLATGLPTTIWTAESALDGDWEIYDELESSVSAGEPTEVRLPVDVEGRVRFYRLSTRTDGAGP